MCTERLVNEEHRSPCYTDTKLIKSQEQKRTNIWNKNISLKVNSLRAHRSIDQPDIWCLIVEPSKTVDLFGQFYRELHRGRATVPPRSPWIYCFVGACYVFVLCSKCIINVSDDGIMPKCVWENKRKLLKDYCKVFKIRM